MLKRLSQATLPSCRNLTPIRAPVRLKLLTNRCELPARGLALAAYGEGLGLGGAESIMRIVALICTALALSTVASAVQGQQTPEQQPAPSQQEQVQQELPPPRETEP